MTINALKYLPAITIPAFLLLSLTGTGWLSFSLFFYAFILVPLLEQLFPASQKNMNKVEEALAKEDKMYDYVLYLMFPIHFGLLFCFCYTLNIGSWSTLETVGKVLSMSLACGAFGINIAHELGHRHTRFEKNLSKGFLLSSLYMHFHIEHNRGHHLRVATEEDPATARYGEIFYVFFLRSVITGFFSAWKLENARLKKLGLSAIHWKNEMIWFTVIQTCFCLFIGLVFSPKVMLFFIAAAIGGFMTLETVNYIEHYGLLRNKKDNGGYEKVLPIHSWNSNHFLGRVLLFELTRHSDHHFRPSRPYQLLRHFEDSPQLPAGYPAMMVLALFPPLWFLIMNRQIKNLRERYASQLA